MPEIYESAFFALYALLLGFYGVLWGIGHAIKIANR